MSFKLAISLCLSLCITIVLGKSLRIIGGNPADIREFPHSASFKLILTGNHFCGGSIISERHILTAAHCLTKYDPHTYRVYIGGTNYKISGQDSFAIVLVKVYPGFTGQLRKRSVLHNDIGIVKVDRQIIFNEFQNKVRLPRLDPQVDSLASISGWGSTINSIKQHPETLQKTTMRILNNFECSHILPFNIHNEQICAYHSQGVGACYGDSGVGLISKGEIVGIASFVCPCAVGKPDIYTRVYSYIDFINCVLADTDFIRESNSRCSIQ